MGRDIRKMMPDADGVQQQPAFLCAPFCGHPAICSGGSCLSSNLMIGRMMPLEGLRLQNVAKL